MISSDSRTQFAAFAALAFFFGAVRFWSPITRAFQRRQTRSRDERFAQEVFPRLRGFVSRFGDFVSNRHSDTLHYIVTRELSREPREALTRYYEATPIEHWSSLWEHLEQRVRRQTPTFTELAPLISEFNNLVGQYHAYCLAPIYDRMNDDLRAQLSDGDVRKLRKFQQQHHAFTTDYTEFLRSLSQSHPALEHLPRYLPMSNPL